MDTLELFAKKHAGNWKEFQCFTWDYTWNGEIDNPEDWTIIYTSNRDSDLLSQSNESVINKRMAKHVHSGNAMMEHHNHWAVGYVDGLSIKVYTKRKQITAAFREWYHICKELDNYPLLDEEDYYKRIHESTLNSIKDALHMFSMSTDLIDPLPDNYDYAIYHWLSDNGYDNELDTEDYYPSDESLNDVCEALGYLASEEDTNE